MRLFWLNFFVLGAAAATSGCSSSKAAKTKSTDAAVVDTETPQADSGSTDGGTSENSKSDDKPGAADNDTRKVEFVDDQKNDDDDFVIAETSTYISGANLVDVKYYAQEVGGKKRTVPIDLDPQTKSATAILPRDGYFVVKVGEKAAIVPPSSGPLQFTFRSYHIQTEKLLNIALGIGIDELISTRTLDIGTFSYLGHVFYRSVRRNPDLFEKEPGKIKEIVNQLVSANKLHIKGQDPAAIALALEKQVESLLTPNVSARSEFAINKSLAGVFTKANATPPIDAALASLSGLSDQSSQLRNVANEVNYLNAVAKVEKIEALPRQLVEDLSINTWRQVSSYSDTEAKEFVKTGALGADVSSLLQETNTAAGSAPAVLEAVFNKRKWRLSESFQNPGLAVQGGRLIRSKDEILFTFFGSPRGVPLNQTHPTVNLYTRTYKNGYWYERKEVAKNLTPGNFLLDQYCVSQGCFIATYVGETPLNPPVNGNQYEKYYLQMFILKKEGEIIAVPKIEGYQFGLMRNGTTDKLDVALLKERKVSILTFDINGNVSVKKTFEGDDFSNLYAVNFVDSSVLSLRRTQFITTDAYPEGYWIWRNYFQVDDGPLTEISTGFQFGYVTGLDLSQGSLSVSVTAATKQPTDDRFSARLNVYDLKDPNNPALMFGPLATKVSFKPTNAEAVPGDFSSCRLANDYWFMFGSVHDIPSGKNYLYGFSEKLPATASISGILLDNGTYARNGVLDCSYQQALYWMSESPESQSVKALNISETGQFSEQESVISRSGNDLRILAMTTLSDKSGFRAIIGLQADNMLVTTPPGSGYDLSRTDLIMYLFE